jgi:hypothetical protein
MPTICANDAFSTSRARFEQVCCFMGGEEASGFTHGELEARLTVDVHGPPALPGPPGPA